MNRRIAVLGSNGFVGSALVKELIKNGELVDCLAKPDFDLIKPESYDRISPQTDILIHSAGHVGNAPTDDILWKINVESCYYLSKHLQRLSNLKLFIFISSGAVYGMHKHPISLYSKLNPESLYGLSKLLAEQIFKKLLPCRVIILRLFFPFGPNQKVPRLIPSLIDKINHGEPVEIAGREGITINPIFIDNLVSNILNIINKPNKAIFNLGGSQSITIRRIAEIVGQTIGKIPNVQSNLNEAGAIVCIPDLQVIKNSSIEAELTKTIKMLLANNNRQ
jgi:nucleoside-diphosphate-sugar epimerase